MGPKNAKLVAGVWAETTEADHFAKILLHQGVPAARILVEEKPTNLGENLLFSYGLLRDNGLDPDSIILIHKPYLERRVFAAAEKQWPNPQTKI